MKKILISIAIISTFIAYGLDLTLVSPTNNFRFSNSATRQFIWNPPTGIVSTSGIVYTLKIVELPSVTTITASDFTTTTGFYTQTIGGISLTTTSSHIVPTAFNANKYYAWNIRARVETSNQTIFTQSEVQYFKGKLSLEVFRAGFYNVFMEEIFNPDLTTFSGRGICPTGLGNTRSVTFSGLYITNEGGIFVLELGAITHLFPNDTILPLVDNAGRSSASNVVSQFRLDKDNLTTTRSIRLNTKLKNNTGQDVILSCNNVASGTVPLNSSSHLLSNISNLSLQITGAGSTNMYISGNNYDIYYQGGFNLPIDKYSNSDPLNFSFVTAIDYLTPQSISGVSKINVPSIAGLSFSSDSVFIDLTTTVSPPIYASNPAWQGMVFRNCSLSYTTTLKDYNFPINIPFPNSVKRVAVIDNNANMNLVSTFTGTLTSPITLFPRSANMSITAFDFDRNNLNAQKSIMKGKFKLNSNSLRNLGEFDLTIDETNTNNIKIIASNSSISGSLAKSYIFDYSSNASQPFRISINNNDPQATIKIQASKNNEPFNDLVYTFVGNNQYQITSGLQTNTGYSFRVLTTYDNATKTDTSLAISINIGNFLQTVITEKIIHNTTIKTHPNPFLDEIKVSDFEVYNIYSVELIHCTGAVTILNNYSSKANELVIQTENITSGLYTLKITTTKGVFVSKVLKR